MITNFKRQFWISLSIILGSIIIVVVALSYLAGTITTQSDKIAADRSLVAKQSDSLDVLADLKDQAPQAATYQAAMDKLLPTQDGLIDFSQWVAALATAHQVAASVSFQGNNNPSIGGAPGQAGFSITVTGSLDNISAFLDDAISKSPGFFVQINSFDLVYKNPDYNLTGQGILFFR